MGVLGLYGVVESVLIYKLEDLGLGLCVDNIVVILVMWYGW